MFPTYLRFWCNYILDKIICSVFFTLSTSSCGSRRVDLTGENSIFFQISIYLFIMKERKKERDHIYKEKIYLMEAAKLQFLSILCRSLRANATGKKNVWNYFSCGRAEWNLLSWVTDSLSSRRRILTLYLRRAVWIIRVPFLCYQFFQNVWMFLHKPIIKSSVARLVVFNWIVGP